MAKLALLGGGKAAASCEMPPWPVVSDRERRAIAAVIDSGRFTAVGAGAGLVAALERDWARRVGVAHCIAVANGTIALSIALAAAGVRAGDEVIVPSLSFIGSALAPVHIGAVPVFVDVNPVTFNLDVAGLTAALSPRTTAIVPVHLHGLPADLDEITAFAATHGLVVVEDAAQSHGVRYRGRVTGSVGAAGIVSLNVSKNLPTCGEGGLITTDDDGVAGRARIMRQFGEEIPTSGERPYVSRVLGWNGKIGTMQAVFTHCQLATFDEVCARRDANVRRLLGRIAVTGIVRVPDAPADREHGWHILRFRPTPAAFGLDAEFAPALGASLRRVLRAEGVPVGRYQTMPLGDQPVFATGEAANRVVGAGAARAVIADSFVLTRPHLNPDAGPVLEIYADAFEKVREHADVITNIAVARHRQRRPLVTAQ